MPEEDVRPLFRQLVKGVSYAHLHHITHRDLKLENILIARLVAFRGNVAAEGPTSA